MRPELQGSPQRIALEFIKRIAELMRMWPLWLRRGIARLPPLPRHLKPILLKTYLPKFSSPDDGGRCTWKPIAGPKDRR